MRPGRPRCRSGRLEVGAMDKNFTMEAPALVCRWRLAAATLPLENRHLRALSRRSVNGRPVSPQLVAWAKQHIEWTLGEGASAHPDGVLMLVVDEAGQAAMTVGPYEPLSQVAGTELASRALESACEGEKTGVEPESLWAVRDGELIWGASDAARASGAATLVADLARTLGLPVSHDAGLASRVLSGAMCDEVFLVSDEHGIVIAKDATGALSERFLEGYDKLLAAADHHGRPGFRL